MSCKSCRLSTEVRASVVRLSYDFYEALMERPVPVDSTLGSRLPPLSRLGDRRRTAAGDKQINCLKHRSLAAVVSADNEVDSGEVIERIRLEGTKPSHLE